MNKRKSLSLTQALMFVALMAATGPSYAGLGDFLCKVVLKKDSESKSSADETAVAGIKNPSTSSIKSSQMQSEAGVRDPKAANQSLQRESARNRFLSQLKGALQRFQQKLKSVRVQYREYQIEFGHLSGVYEIYSVAMKQHLLDPGVSFENFKYSIERDPLNNFYPLIQRIDLTQHKFRYRQQILDLIRRQIRYTEPPGVHTSSSSHPKSQELRSNPGLGDIRQNLALVSKIDYSNNFVQYYRWSHRLNLLGENFDVPEFEPLKVDNLTGLLRVEGATFQLVKDIIELSQTPQWLGRVAFVFLDLNDLSSTNHMAEGYEAGDKYLRSFARASLEGFRKMDFLFRVGGDEFIGFIIDVNETEAASIVDRVITNVHNDPEIKELFQTEAKALPVLDHEMKAIKDLQSLVNLAHTHTGLNEHVEPAIKEAQEQRVSVQETFQRAMKAADTFVKGMLKKVRRMHPGVSPGIVMIQEYDDWDTLKVAGSRQSNRSKKFYKYQVCPPGEYDEDKYGPISDVDQLRYPRDPQARPQVQISRDRPKRLR